MENGGFWFKSSLFEIEPGEDEAINPGVYGMQLADWLATKLGGLGYNAEVIEEDWGRCIMCLRDPVWLWVGCGNIHLDFPELPTRMPNKEDIVWHCFVVCEIPFWKRLFNRIDREPFRKTLTDQLASIFSSEARITLVEEP